MLGLNGRLTMMGAFAALLGGALAGGCQIEDPAEEDVERLLTVLCEQTETCRCAGSEDANACDVRRTTWDGRLKFGRAKGLIFDAECVESIETRVQTRGCLDATDGNGVHLCENFCAVFHGNVELGGDCEGHDTVTSNCVQGTTCLDGRCVEPCDTLGGLAEGALCRDEIGNVFDDCATNLICDPSSRRCITLPEVGERCSGSGECTRDAYCDWNTETCRAAVAVGERCGEADCVSGAHCEWDESGGTCRADRTIGQSCRDSNCADGLLCDYDRDACVMPSDEGESCGGGCAEGLLCIDSTCRTLPEEGDACEGQCADGLWCDWDIRRCAALPDGEGQPCPIGECGGRLWCDTSNTPEGECQLRAPFGETCTGHRQCETGFCPAGFCDDLPLLGESCAQAGACANGLVCDGEMCVTALSRGSAVCSFAGW
jgi:hypothetical protein